MSISLENIVGAMIILTLSVGVLYAAISSRPGRRESEVGRQDDYETGERSRMPDEIKSAKLVISEKTFYRRGKRPFAAKTDQGFETRAGWLVLVESKTRRRISASDIVQVSCQALAVASTPGNPWRVASWGYVRLAPVGGKPYYQRVDLMHPSRIDVLWDRWHALKHGQVKPVRRPDPSRCRTCLLKSRCSAARLN